MNITPGIYRHYKGNRYQVVGVAKHTETMEDLVVYKSLDEQAKVWVRPLAMFNEQVVVGGVNQPRFTFMGAA